jgi:hypothetical protein
MQANLLEYIALSLMTSHVRLFCGLLLEWAAL